MEKIKFTADINAPKQKVWNVLWDKTSYEKWSSVFAPGSTFSTDWKEGSKIIFGDGKGSGMVSRIAVKKENEYMSFEHLGEVKDGIEDTTSDAVKMWAGSHENYTLTETSNGTKLDVDMDISPEFKDMFMNMWPKAMDEIKKLSEN